VTDPEDDPRVRALALLEATHRFPTEYSVSVIVRNDAAVMAQLRDTVEHGLTARLPVDAYETVQSSGGKYSSHRFRVPCRTAEDVLDLYDRIRRIDGVMSVL